MGRRNRVARSKSSSNKTMHELALGAKIEERSGNESKSNSEHSDNQSQCSESNSESRYDSESDEPLDIIEICEGFKNRCEFLSKTNKGLKKDIVEKDNLICSLTSTTNQLELKVKSLEVDLNQKVSEYETKLESLRRERDKLQEANQQLENNRNRLESSLSSPKESSGHTEHILDTSIEGSLNESVVTEPESQKETFVPRPIAFEHASPAQNVAHKHANKYASSSKSHTSKHTSNARNNVDRKYHAYQYDRRGSRNYTPKNYSYQPDHETPRNYAYRDVHTPSYHDNSYRYHAHNDNSYIYHDPRIHQTPNYTYKQNIHTPRFAKPHSWQSHHDYSFHSHPYHDPYAFNAYYSSYPDDGFYGQFTRPVWVRKTEHKPKVRKVWVPKKSQPNLQGPEI